MMKININNLKLKDLCSLILLWFLFISMSYVSANETNFKTNYTPQTGDYFMFIGSTKQTEGQYNDRLITNTSTSEQIDYNMNSLEQKSLQKRITNEFNLLYTLLEYF